MPVINSSYKAPLWIGGKHAQTIIPNIFRKVSPAPIYMRERTLTADHDFLDLDFSSQGHDRLAIITHGLEGNSSSSYVLGMVKEFNANQWDVLAWNFRSCGGELNHSIRLYHAGSTDDLQHVIEHVLKMKKYKEIVLIGFSLGANIILKYLGEQAEEVPREISKAIAVSAPCDLFACIQALSSGINRIYIKHFLLTLKSKMIKKAKKFPEIFSGIKISKIQHIIEFDNLITAPLCGFKDAFHYYSECSSKKNISEIRVPTLILNAQNDPFLHPSSFPYEECQKSRFVTLETPYDGGHIGFIKKRLMGKYWMEERAIDFVSK
ncbi:MAG TPA: alpha/beta fold hydrolase [Rhabdochlamydiaceae bacterium]|nr:alpha/beta fold hydrolase [Rhabdochlamydiaceae bacterium]